MQPAITLQSNGDMADLSNAIGRSESVTDYLAPKGALALAATLNDFAFLPSTGALLPPLWHWIFHSPSVALRDIDQDGHPLKGGFLPPVQLPRRMWAGGRLVWENSNPLKLGQYSSRRSTIQSISQKKGRDGALVFVTILHELYNEFGLAMSEHQDIVYREPAKSKLSISTSASTAPSATWHKTVTPSEVLLFRYSALTFNAHRIHYDLPYATELEGYPALVVHGPLLATLLMQLIRDNVACQAIRKFEFKSVAPAFAGRTLHLKGNPPDRGALKLWAEDDEGHVLMTAMTTVD